MDRLKSFLSRALLLYILKCLAGFSAAYWLYLTYPEHEFYWSMITVFLVIAPDPRDGNRLAFERVGANVIGSFTGMLLAFLGPTNFALICAGVLATILVCWLFRLGNVTRTALAALVIVMVHRSTGSAVEAALERVGCVLVGALIGVAVTVVFEEAFNRRAVRRN